MSGGVKEVNAKNIQVKQHRQPLKVHQSLKAGLKSPPKSSPQSRPTTNAIEKVTSDEHHFFISVAWAIHLWSSGFAINEANFASTMFT